jgi:RNA polymerase sigma-70 factor (ECF subfamily)
VTVPEPAAHARVERDVRAKCDTGDHAGAATAILQGYGPEIFGFLMAIHRDRAEADEVFAELAEGIWTGLPRFAWESSVRTWAYSVARHASTTRLRNAKRRERRIVHRTGSFFEEVAEKVRTETSAFLRTARKTRLEELRDELPEEDRSLLVLRIDRGLAWKDLARILSEADPAHPPDEEFLARESARLRKRFQVVKDRLREMARREGLVG